jgi:uncharacterized membrane protein YfcA
LGGVFSYWREKRVLWQLGFVAAAGGIFGSILGPRLRTGPLAEIGRFEIMFGILMGLVGLGLIFKKKREIKVGKVESMSGSLFKQEFIFAKNTYTYSTVIVFIAGIFAGTVSTSFGIGTGILLVPFYTAVLKLPIYAVASSALLSTLIISFSGTFVYSSLNGGFAAAPDIKLGFLLGVGGVIGGFTSAKVQKKLSSNTLHKLLGIILIIWSLIYIKQGF